MDVKHKTEVDYEKVVLGEDSSALEVYVLNPYAGSPWDADEQGIPGVSGSGNHHLHLFG